MSNKDQAYVKAPLQEIGFNSQTAAKIEIWSISSDQWIAYHSMQGKMRWEKQVVSKY